MSTMRYSGEDGPYSPDFGIGLLQAHGPTAPTAAALVRTTFPGAFTTAHASKTDRSR
ncbi:hypothetical protein [Streptomyces brevispora]|uniref:Uncharacterized protein n=1 Tax=Streptomyces brevispora TaxID=887462 RepID=A0ABZ1FWH4_9ACTN|nr:hypothetical protein [Streptomyces brevispora]WSC11959.1 hypothetical protein OIE64_03250 [Streptomyces brevispora]